MVRTVDNEHLNHLLRMARLELSPERHEAVTAATTLVFGLADSLDEVELGETVPATAFNARWQ